MTLHRRLFALAAAGAVLITLTGCSVGVVDGSAEKPAAEKPADAPATAPQTEPAADPADGPDAETPDATDRGITRDSVIAAATTTQRCDGELTILDNAVIIRVEGACDRLILNSTGSMVVADDVDYLSVIGDGNAVFVGTVDQMVVNGDANLVNWTGATANVQDVGSANVLQAG